MQPDLVPLAEAMPLERLFDIDCCVDPSQRRANSNSCYDRRLPYCGYRPARPGSLAIVASGPSAKDYISQLQAWDGEIWAINGAFNWLINEGVKVHAFVGMDPEPFLVDYLKVIPTDATYYIANQVHPGVFDHLKDRNVRTWHVTDPAVMPPRGQYPVTGGSTCLSRAPVIACMMGWQDVHIFGGDSSFSDEGYAYGGAVPGAECIAELDGVKYRTNRQMMTQAIEMVEMMKNFPGSISIHGAGLLPAMAEQHKPGFEKLKKLMKKMARAA